MQVGSVVTGGLDELRVLFGMVYVMNVLHHVRSHPISRSTGKWPRSTPPLKIKYQVSASVYTLSLNCFLLDRKKERMTAVRVKK